MLEEWRDIKGFEGYYQVSSLGRVRTLVRNTKCGKRGGKSERNPEGLLTLHECATLNRKRGWQTYLQVKLTKNGQRKMKLVHRLVAEAFVPNPESLKTVNHKNGDKHDNRIDNLEWKSQSDNIKHSINQLGQKRIAKRTSKEVVCLETHKVYKSAVEASKDVGLKSASSILSCCRGDIYYKTAGGFHWEFRKEKNDF